MYSNCVVLFSLEREKTNLPSSSILLSCATSNKFFPISASTGCSVPSGSQYVIVTVSFEENARVVELLFCMFGMKQLSARYADAGADVPCNFRVIMFRPTADDDKLRSNIMEDDMIV